MMQDRHAVDAHRRRELANRKVLLSFGREHLQRRIHEVLAAYSPPASTGFLVFVLQPEIPSL
jgi:hypothetical protein